VSIFLFIWLSSLIKITRDGYISFFACCNFLPEEDDKYLDRVKAAVEEEERQAATAAQTDAVKDAILTAEELRRAKQFTGSQEAGSELSKNEPTVYKNQENAGISEKHNRKAIKLMEKDMDIMILLAICLLSSTTIIMEVAMTWELSLR
jgi:mannitol-specific phosphotransferase system IIBC component